VCVCVSLQPVTTVDIVVADHCSGPRGKIGPVRRVCVCVCRYKLLLPTAVVVRVVRSVGSVARARVCVVTRRRFMAPRASRDSGESSRTTPSTTGRLSVPDGVMRGNCAHRQTNVANLATL